MLEIQYFTSIPSILSFFFFVSIIHLFYAHIQWDLKSVQHFWDENYENKYFIDLIYWEWE